MSELLHSPLEIQPTWKPEACLSYVLYPLQWLIPDQHLGPIPWLMVCCQYPSTDYVLLVNSNWTIKNGTCKTYQNLHFLIIYWSFLGWMESWPIWDIIAQMWKVENMVAMLAKDLCFQFLQMRKEPDFFKKLWTLSAWWSVILEFEKNLDSWKTTALSPQ